jgi:hypothetical protein
MTALLRSKGSYSTVACVFVAAGMCLPSRFLAINVYFDFIITAFGVISQYFTGRSQRLWCARHLVFWPLEQWDRGFEPTRNTFISELFLYFSCCAL